MLMNNKFFDERQLKIRGEVFFHGLIAAFALLLINALLQGLDIVWASGFHQNIIIFFFTGMVVIIEAILRDAFFGMGQMRWPIIGAFGVLSAVLIYGVVHSFAQGNALVEAGALTHHGFMLVGAVMPVSVTVAGLIKEIIEKRRNHE